MLTFIKVVCSEGTVISPSLLSSDVVELNRNTRVYVSLCVDLTVCVLIC